MGADQLTSTGLQVKAFNDIIADITTALQAAYGLSINLSQNSPDTQLMNIYAQSAADLRQLLVAVYNSFSPQSAFGTTLDQRLALNGLARLPGTYTIQNVQITTSQAIALTGLDALIANPSAQIYTVADNAGNQFQLVTSQSPVGAGTYTYIFQSAKVGAVQTLPNTITNQVTVVLGVTGVNNPSVATTTGVNEETDSQFKIRHAKSFFLASSGPVDSVLANLLALSDVTGATVIENTTNATVNTLPAHSIWAIVEGGTAQEIGQAIYAKKAPGCSTFGSSSAVIIRPNGGSVTINYSAPIYQNLWIKFTILPRNAGEAFDHVAIANSLVAAISYKINQQASIGDPISAMASIAPDAILTSVGVSTDGVNYFDTATPTTNQYKFLIATSRITIS